MISYLLGLHGPSSNSPCPWCKLDRQQTTDPACLKGNSVRTLKNYDGFFEIAEPRCLSDWDDLNSNDLKPINPDTSPTLLEQMSNSISSGQTIRLE